MVAGSGLEMKATCQVVVVGNPFGAESIGSSGGRKCCICFASEFDSEECVDTCGEWVAPCSCKGTQKWIHLGCLRAWQSSCLKNESYKRATTCAVCNTFYSYQPIHETIMYKLRHRMSKSLKPLLIVLPAFFGLPMLAAFQFAMFWVVFGVLTGFAKTVLNYSDVDVGEEQVDDTNSVIHEAEQGPVEGSERASSRLVTELRTGQVLSAAPGMKEVSFSGAIIILERYHPLYGARGLIINEPMCPVVRKQMQLKHPVFSDDTWVGSGGPLSPSSVSVLHDLPHIPGSSQIRPGLYLGHYASARFIAIEHANHEHLKLYFGCTVWAKGQLEREIRRGMWQNYSHECFDPEVLQACEELYTLPQNNEPIVSSRTNQRTQVFSNERREDFDK